MKLITFVGQGNDGHTVVAGMLDAHPNIAISNRYAPNLSSKEEELIKQICGHSKAPIRNKWAYRYDHSVKGQGEWNTLQAVGHTHIAAWHTCPETMEAKAICMLRSPYDVIGRSSKKILGRQDRRRKRGEIVDSTVADVLDVHIKHYVRWASKAHRNLTERPTIGVHLEKLILDPMTALQNIITFLDLDWDEQWANEAIKVVWKTPSHSCKLVKWEQYQIDKVKEVVDKYTFLRAAYGNAPCLENL